MRHAEDRPSIGLLLCRSKQRTTVEYALRGLTKPIGVAEWAEQLTAALPEELKGSLPTVEELERELRTPEAVAIDGTRTDFRTDLAAGDIDRHRWVPFDLNL